MGRRVRNPLNPGLLLVILFAVVSWWLAGHRAEHPREPERPAAPTESPPSPAPPTTNTAPSDPCDPQIVAEFHGRVTHVQDGDSFKLETTDRRTITVRMKSIDAPEKNQPSGDAARQNLKRLIENQRVTIRSVGEDQYERTLGYVVFNGEEVNERLVRDGWAWHYSKDSCERRFATAEASARSARRGLWAQGHPQPPWEFRREHRRN